MRSVARIVLLAPLLVTSLGMYRCSPSTLKHDRSCSDGKVVSASRYVRSDASISYVALEVGGCVADVVVIAGSPGQQRRAEHRPLRIDASAVDELARALKEAGAAGVRSTPFDPERCAEGSTSITGSVDYFRPSFVPGYYRVHSFPLGPCSGSEGADRVWQVLKRWADEHVEPGLL